MFVIAMYSLARKYGVTNEEEEEEEGMLRFQLIQPVGNFTRVRVVSLFPLVVLLVNIS